ncbi:MAG: hypothetical protein FIA95_07045 [Gemmatimonadetes bacterium]|nr:hypothetical protein [Gemmatimonadota bacterium]
MRRRVRASRALLAPLGMGALAVAAGCGSPGGAPAPGAAAPPPSITAAGTTLYVNVAPSRGVVADAVQATPDAAWAALPRAYADLGIPVKEVSDASRTLGNSRFVVSRRLGDTPLSRYLECGAGLTGAFADRYRIEMLIRTTVQPGEAGGARVESYLEASARNPEGSSNTGVACASTQRLERAIAERVRFHTGGGG